MKRNTFTLIEILGVLVVIAILATLGFAGYSYANNKSKESATQGLITRLGAAFEVAQQKSGFIPPATSFSTITINQSNNTLTIGGNTYYLVPRSQDQDSRSIRVKKMEAEFCKQFLNALQMDSMSRFMENNEVIDAWGNPVRFRYPGVLKTGGFDLIAAGSDGGFGSDSDATPSGSMSDYRDGNEWICDDIANF